MEEPEVISDGASREGDGGAPAQGDGGAAAAAPATDQVEQGFTRSWQVAQPTTTCSRTNPQGRAVLYLERDCTCGEPHACHVELRGATLQVEFRYDLAAPSACDDCYPRGATCALPDLPRAAALTLVVNGSTVATVRTDGAGHLVGLQCP